MIGLLIIAHGDLGKTLIQSATHVLGAAPARVASIAVVGRADPDALLRDVKQQISVLDDGSGVLLLTDMLGGTPSNVATRALVPGRVDGVCGASLPMVVRALTYRHAPLATVVVKATSGGLEGVGHLIPASTPHATSGN
ncbi:MAG: PTS sugar transporter subunit IIA [Burkholderiales bacterium]